jgi:diacylglycerol kinase
MIKKPVKYNLFRSFGYAFSGLRYAFSRELNIRIQLGVGVFFIALSVFHWQGVLAFLHVGIVALIIGFELMNTAIEYLADVYTQEKDERIRRIKDVSAASVLTAAMGWGMLIIYTIYKIVMLYIEG